MGAACVVLHGCRKLALREPCSGLCCREEQEHMQHLGAVQRGRQDAFGDVSSKDAAAKLRSTFDIVTEDH